MSSRVAAGRGRCTITRPRPWRFASSVQSSAALSSVSALPGVVSESAMPTEKLAPVSTREVNLLCETYQRASDDTRHLIRLTAAAVVEEALARSPAAA